MTNETNELKTYTMQQLYAQPLEPVEYLVDGLPRVPRCSTWHWRTAHSGCTSGPCGWRTPRQRGCTSATGQHP